MIRNPSPPPYDLNPAALTEPYWNGRWFHWLEGGGDYATVSPPCWLQSTEGETNAEEASTMGGGDMREESPGERRSQRGVMVAYAR